MVEADLRRLVKEGYIMSYDILEQDREGNVLELSVRLFPPMDAEKLSERLAQAAGTARKLSSHFVRYPGE